MDDDGSSLLPTSLVGANEGGGTEVRMEGRQERRREGEKKGEREAGLAGPAGSDWVQACIQSCSGTFRALVALL